MAGKNKSSSLIPVVKKPRLMPLRTNNIANHITTEDLSSMGKEQLIDLLVFKTDLLIKATVLKVPDHSFIKELTEEVKKLQELIASKK